MIDKKDQSLVQDIREKKREDWEKGLKFAGFVVKSCPLKPDTKAMIREIIDSSHRVKLSIISSQSWSSALLRVQKKTNDVPRW